MGARDIILPRYFGEYGEEYWDFGELLVSGGKWAWDGPVAIYPIQINERVRAQRGWFTIHGNDRRPLEEQFPKLVIKLVLDAPCVTEGRSFLQMSGFNRIPDLPRSRKSRALDPRRAIALGGPEASLTCARARFVPIGWVRRQPRNCSRMSVFGGTVQSEGRLTGESARFTLFFDSPMSKRRPP